MPVGSIGAGVYGSSRAPVRPVEAHTVSRVSGVSELGEGSLYGDSRPFDPATPRCGMVPREGRAMFRVDILASGETRWATNALKFDSETEAEAYARNLYSRWMSMERASVVPVDSPEREAYVSGSRGEVSL